MADGSKGASPGCAALIRTGPQSNFQPFAAANRRRLIDRGLVSRRVCQNDPARLATALRNRRRHRRNVFSWSRALDGSLLHVARRRSPVRAGVVGNLAAGGGLRWITHNFWGNHCEEIRWLNKTL